MMLFFGSLVAISGSGDETVVASNSVLMIDLNENFGEQSEKNPLASFSGGQSASIGLNDILKSIKEAKTDAKIKGIYVKLGVCQNGWSTLHDIHDALEDFKSSKKFLYAYGEIADQKSIYVSTACDKTFINPQGGAEFKGLSIVGMFFKGTLDKMDIKTEAFHCGQFKGAHEPYSRQDFSEANRAQLQVILNDIYGGVLTALAKKSGKDTATVAAMINDGKIRFPKDALQEKFIDGLVYGDSVEHIMKSALSLKNDDKIEFITPDDYVDGTGSKNHSKDKVAVLYAEGAIYDGENQGSGDIYSKDMTKEIRKIAHDESIKAVVLRVNSPGGSALASEVIYHELTELRKKKPIVVSMGNYAASGGYYISCAADSLFADVNTLTGSIGVVGVLMNTGDFMKNKLGITTDVVKTSNYADFPNLTRPMTDIERNWIQNYLDTTYTRFKSLVAKNRKMDMQTVENLAQGHVYTGKTALSLKLVDALGNQERAIQSVAGIAKLKEYKVVEFPKPKDKISELIASITGKKGEDARLQKILGEDYVVFKEIQKIRSQQNRIQMVMPWMIQIN